MNINKLKNILQEKKMTYETLANLIGMTRNGLSDAINKQTIKIATLEKIANIIGVPVTYFFDDTTGATVHQTANGNNNNQIGISLNECNHKVTLLEERIEGLKKEIQSKDKIIKLLETNK